MTGRYDRWPQVLREIAEDIGEAEALRLAGAAGGQRLYIPYTDAPAIIDRMVGPTLAAWLRAHYGGVDLHVPNFAARLADERRRYVLRHAYLSANDIAAALGVTSRRVEQIRAEHRGDPRQFLLFG